jgi:hypothetical protein
MAELIAMILGQRPIGVVQISQLWIIGHKSARRGRRPRQEIETLHQRRLARTRVRGPEEGDVPRAIQEGRQRGFAFALLVGIAQDLLDENAAEAVTDEGDRPRQQVRLIRQNPGDPPRLVEDRHRRAGPIGRR